MRASRRAKENVGRGGEQRKNGRWGAASLYQKAFFWARRGHPDLTKCDGEKAQGGTLGGKFFP